MSSPIWEARAALFVRPRTVSPIVKLCAKGLHNIYETGLSHFTQRVNGKKYHATRCTVCAREAVKRCLRKKRAA